MLSFSKNFQKITVDNFNEIRIFKSKRTIREIIKAALAAGISVFRVFDKKEIFLLKKGQKTFWVDRVLSSAANPVGVNVVRNKFLTQNILKKMGYPTSPSVIIESEQQLISELTKMGFPAVIKPLSAAAGSGVTVNISTTKLALDSFNYAKEFDERIILEKFIRGDYYRITYLMDGSYAATKNLPAYITGNGRNTAEELIGLENKKNKDRRKKGRLKKIKISKKTERFLAAHGYNLNSVVPFGEKLPLCFSGFDGGEYIDVTEIVNPYFLKLGADVTKFFGLPIVGIDIISKDISVPLNENGGVVIEINGTYPDLVFHLEPTQGKSRNLAPDLIKFLFK